MNLPKRKHTRLKEYDYSQNGYYHTVISTENNLPILSKIVGRGLAPADCISHSLATTIIKPELSTIGEIAEQQLFELENRYPYVRIDKYIIMPTHIHAIIILTGESAGASPRPTLTDIICAYKSLTTRMCNKNDNVQGRKIFQTSFYETIIRNEKGYQEVWQYIDQNPIK